MDLYDSSRLCTPRLELVAATAQSTAFEMQNIGALASALDVLPPASWPPPLHDAASRCGILSCCSKTTRSVGDCGMSSYRRRSGNWRERSDLRGNRATAHAKSATLCCRDLKGSDTRLKLRSV